MRRILMRLVLRLVLIRPLVCRILVRDRVVVLIIRVLILCVVTGRLRLMLVLLMVWGLGVVITLLVRMGLRGCVGFLTFVRRRCLVWILRLSCRVVSLCVSLLMIVLFVGLI